MVTAFLTIANGAVAQRRYNTPDAAVTALIEAVRVGTPARLMRVLGPGSDEVVSSGDPVADAFARKRLLDGYNIRHQIVREGKDNAVLVIGQEEWPLPIPLVRLNNTWRFDAQIARREIVFRRIGRNEQGAIQACLLFVNAQREYAKKGFAGEGVYAQRLLSQSGEKDGLYWPALSGEDASPLAELAAAAAAEGYPITDQPNPYQWLPLSDSHAARAECAWRRNRLRGARQHDRRVRPRGLSGAVSHFRLDDIPRQSSWAHLREGPRLAHGRDRFGHDEF